MGEVDLAQVARFREGVVKRQAQLADLLVGLDEQRDELDSQEAAFEHERKLLREQLARIDGQYGAALAAEEPSRG